MGIQRISVCPGESHFDVILPLIKKFPTQAPTHHHPPTTTHTPPLPPSPAKAVNPAHPRRLFLTRPAPRATLPPSPPPPPSKGPAHPSPAPYRRLFLPGIRRSAPARPPARPPAPAPQSKRPPPASRGSVARRRRLPGSCVGTSRGSPSAGDSPGTCSAAMPPAVGAAAAAGNRRRRPVAPTPEHISRDMLRGDAPRGWGSKRVRALSWGSKRESGGLCGPRHGRRRRGRGGGVAELAAGWV